MGFPEFLYLQCLHLDPHLAFIVACFLTTAVASCTKGTITVRIVVCFSSLMIAKPQPPIAGVCIGRCTFDVVDAMGDASSLSGLQNSFSLFP